VLWQEQHATEEEKEVAEALFDLAARTVAPAKSADVGPHKKANQQDQSGQGGVAKGFGGVSKAIQVDGTKADGRVDEGKVATTSQPTVGATTNHAGFSNTAAPGTHLQLGWPFVGGNGTSSTPAVQNAGGMAHWKKSATRHVYIAHMIAFQQQLQRQAALLYSSPYMGASLAGQPDPGRKRTQNEGNGPMGAVPTSTNSASGGMAEIKERYAGPSHPGWPNRGTAWAGTPLEGSHGAMAMANLAGYGTGASAGTMGPTSTQHAVPHYGNRHTMDSMASQAAQAQFAQQLQSQLGILQQLGFPFGGGQMPGAYGTGPAQAFGSQNAPVHGMPPYFYGREGMPPLGSGMSGGYMQTTPAMASMSMGMQSVQGSMGGVEAGTFPSSLAGHNPSLSLGTVPAHPAAPKLALNLGTSGSHEAASHAPSMHYDLSTHGLGNGSHPRRLPGR